MESGESGQLSEVVAQRIFVVREQRVLLDRDLAALYGVETKYLNQQVRRNGERFPEDFLMLLSNQELAALRLQFATLKAGRGAHRKYPPIAFTEHGAIMAATVLNGPRAVQMSVYVVRAFVHFRRELMKHDELAKELEALKRSVATLDARTRQQFDQAALRRNREAILGLMSAPPKRQ